jgi:transmembrane 9 superfamily protein 3
MFIDDLPIWG